jgi:type I restriction enzyme S subunit
VQVLGEEEYAEIGIYCFGRGIFHKAGRTGLEVGDKSLFLIKEGDFILQVTFAWEGAVALASSLDDGLFGSTRYPTFRVDESRCYPAYLLNYFKTQEGIAQLGKISPGSAGRNRVLNLKRLPEVLVPLPPLEEQRRIAATINNLSEQIEEAKRLRQEIAADRENVCRAMLFNRSVDSKLVPMKELLRLRPLDIAVRKDETYHFAGVYSFGKGVFKGAIKSGADFAYSSLTRLKAGNFVYPKLMAWEGALGIVPPECDGLVVSPEFPVFEVNGEEILPEVLDVYFRTPSVWPALSGTSTGTNVRRRRLNPSAFLEFKMPLPEMSVQQNIREVKNKLDALRPLQEETHIELIALMNSSLDKAFSGAL